MRYPTGLYLLALLSFFWLTACAGGGGLDGDRFTAGFMDDNLDGIYDPYQDQELWEEMKAVTAGIARVGARGDPGPGHSGAPGWRDSDGDGICDFSQNQSLWSKASWGDWFDDNKDSICDNYPLRPQDGSGRGWKGGWKAT